MHIPGARERCAFLLFFRFFTFCVESPGGFFCFGRLILVSVNSSARSGSSLDSTVASRDSTSIASPTSAMAAYLKQICCATNSKHLYLRSFRQRIPINKYKSFSREPHMALFCQSMQARARTEEERERLLHNDPLLLTTCVLAACVGEIATSVKILLSRPWPKMYLMVSHVVFKRNLAWITRHAHI